MIRTIQFITILVISIAVAMSCDSMTGSQSNTENADNESTLLSKALEDTSSTNPTVIVSGETFNPTEYSGWLFNRDPETQTPFVFTDAEASIGGGSLYVQPITNSINGNNDKFIGELFLDEEIANVVSLSYDFLIGSGGDATDENEFYLNVYANFGESDFDKYYDCRYNIVPATGSVSDWTTISFDPGQSYPVATRTGESASPYTCPSIPAEMDDLSPNSTIHFVAINVGDTSGNDQGLDGYYDNVIVSLTDGTTIYDFEPSSIGKTECKKGGWEELGFKNQGQCIRYVNTGKDSREG